MKPRSQNIIQQAFFQLKDWPGSKSMQKKSYDKNSFLQNFYLKGTQGRDYLDDFLL